MSITPKKWVVICCPVSGKKDAVQVLNRDFFPKAKELGLDVDLVLTERAGHATELAKQYGSPECGLILVGGDGTIHEAMDGLIEVKKLDKVKIALLSQGTMNFYWHSGSLPTPAQLPMYLKDNFSRPQSLMKIVDDVGKINTMCFEAIYLGVGYRPAQGAQEWRNSMLGPFFGIMYNLVKCNLFPNSASIEGTLKLWPVGASEPIEVKDKFFWIVVTQRSPYNGALTGDQMWVSYLTLKSFPGFGRMMDSFAPPMECQSGLVNLMECNVNVSKFEWHQSSGTIGVCLDGDPMKSGKMLKGEHVPRAWNIVADEKFPKKVAEAITKLSEPTPAATRWLAKNPPPENTFLPTKVISKETSGLPSTFLLLGGLIVGGMLYFNYFY